QNSCIDETERQFLSHRMVREKLRSGQQTGDDLAGDVRQADVEALELDGEPQVVDAQQMEDGRVQVVYVDDVFDRVVAEFIRCAVGQAAFDAAAAQEHRIAFHVVVAA